MKDGIKTGTIEELITDIELSNDKNIYIRIYGKTVTILSFKKNITKQLTDLSNKTYKVCKWAVNTRPDNIHYFTILSIDYTH